ncbi:antibiotic biosynthesis monooxygenase family protein [Williamsia sterculiae]|uniref:Heme-degrading monooxygenase HmoA n=1 Tax=Williamsia sterculiae TaxID=1344003 RepID=A0A1N7D259_9NOCA|nr:antibiotic biosynthesis monooxygenase family protein [Williamsia sterculiae]SIR69870.1 Heme-degrading monooxygenase HmoA [Williamsia sterculiae]
MNSVSVLTLRVPADKAADVIGYYQRERILQTSGAAAAQLLVDVKDPGTIVVLAWWTDPEAYTAWQQAPERDAFNRGITGIAGASIGGGSQELRVVQYVSGND